MDICFTATQKALAAPPGIAPISISKEAKKYMFNFYEVYSEYLSKFLKQRISEHSEDPLFIDSLIKLEPSVKWDRSIIICPSSMLTDGPSIKYLSQLADDPLGKVILLSEQFQSTVGKLLQEGERNITIEGENLHLRCNIDVIPGFSIHSDYNQLLAYINRLKPKLKKVITNHVRKGNAK